jgi:hypothetical protein
MRPSWDGRPLYPGGSGVHTTVPRPTAAACRFPAASPCHPGTAIRPGSSSNEASSRVHRCSPVQPSPHLWPRADTRALGLSLKLRTPASKTRRRTSRWGQVLNTDQKSRPRHHRTSTNGLTHHVRPHVAISLPIVQLAATASRALPAVASHAIGCAGPRPGGHSHGSWRLREGRGKMGDPSKPR